MKFDRFRQMLGRRVQLMRREFNFTQQELAEQIDVSRQHIQRIERGDTNPTLSTLLALSKALNISLSELVDF